jgi:hypothetical protein
MYMDERQYVLCELLDDLYEPTQHRSERMTISITGSCDRSQPAWSYFYISNPPINFSTVDPTTTYTWSSVDEAKLGPIEYLFGALLLQTPPPRALCSGKSLTEPYLLYNNSFYRHDPRLLLLTNTLHAPANGTALDTNGSDGTNARCPSVVKNFLNRNHCVRKPTCSPPSFSSADIPLNETTVRLWFTLSARHVHIITGLRLEDDEAVSPCTGRSRWRRIISTPSADTDGGGDNDNGGGCPPDRPVTVLDNATRLTLQSALRLAHELDNTNVLLRDIHDPLTTSPSGECNAATRMWMAA